MLRTYHGAIDIEDVLDMALEDRRELLHDLADQMNDAGVTDAE